MYEIFEELRIKKGVSVYRISKETGVPQSTLSAWKAGEYTPKQDKLKKIADYFGVTVDYLLGNEQKNKPALAKEDERDITFDDFTYALHNEAQELTDENKQKLLEMARLFKLSQDQEKNKK